MILAVVLVLCVITAVVVLRNLMLTGRVKDLEERVFDLEMGRPAKIEDGPIRLGKYRRQDR